MTRRVVLVCGPPGAGKTTYARGLGLPLYDIDDAEWADSESAFRSALLQLASTPDAQAVVIRTGATRSARAKTSTLIGATCTYMIATDATTCVQRVISRNRPRPPMRVQIAAVKHWWDIYEPDETSALGQRSRIW